MSLVFFLLLHVVFSPLLACFLLLHFISSLSSAFISSSLSGILGRLSEEDIRVRGVLAAVGVDPGVHLLLREATRRVVGEVLLVDHVALQKGGGRLREGRQELRRDDPGRDAAQQRRAHHADRVVGEAPYLSDSQSIQGGGGSGTDGHTR